MTLPSHIFYLFNIEMNQTIPFYKYKKLLGVLGYD